MSNVLSMYMFLPAGKKGVGGESTSAQQGSQIEVVLALAPGLAYPAMMVARSQAPRLPLSL